MLGRAVVMVPAGTLRHTVPTFFASILHFVLMHEPRSPLHCLLCRRCG